MWPYHFFYLCVCLGAMNFPRLNTASNDEAAFLIFFRFSVLYVFVFWLILKAFSIFSPMNFSRMLTAANDAADLVYRISDSLDQIVHPFVLWIFRNMRYMIPSSFVFYAYLYSFEPSDENMPYGISAFVLLTISWFFLFLFMLIYIFCLKYVHGMLNSMPTYYHFVCFGACVIYVLLLLWWMLSVLVCMLFGVSYVGVTMWCFFFMRAYLACSILHATLFWFVDLYVGLDNRLIALEHVPAAIPVDPVQVQQLIHEAFIEMMNEQPDALLSDTVR